MPANLGFLGLSRLAKPLTGEEGRKILERDRYRCQYCGLDGLTSFENSLIMSVDFIQPRARKGKKERSGRQGCESGGVRVPVPSIACFGRLAYPGHAEVTKHDVPGRRSHRPPRRKLRRWERPGWQANREA